MMNPCLHVSLNHPILTDNIQYPLDSNLIHDRQLLDIQLILNQQTHPLKFPSINLILLDNPTTLDNRGRGP